MERFKSALLLFLIVLSLVLSYAYITGPELYTGFPSLLTRPPQTVSGSDEDEVRTEILLPEILAPERLIEHRTEDKRLFYLTTNDYAFESWKTVDRLLNHRTEAEIQEINREDWNKAVAGQGWEFILAGSYPVEVLFPFWQSEGKSITFKIDRIFISNEPLPQVYLRQAADRKYYHLEIENSRLSGDIFTEMEVYPGMYSLVYDVGQNNPAILEGVYLEENFLARYAKYYPQIHVLPERYAAERWLPRFFTNYNLARRISLGDNKTQYNIGLAALTLDYAGFPHLRYDYSILSDSTADATPVSYYQAIDGAGVFISEHEISTWLDFTRGVRLSVVDGHDNKYSFEYRNYADALDIGIPILSSEAAFKVNSSGLTVTQMTRHIWQYGRFNYTTKIELDAPQALERLSSDEYKVDLEWNPYGRSTVEQFQSLINGDYKVIDIYLAYLVPDDLFSEALISPFWTVILANSSGEKVRFFINAMSGYVPAQNGLIFR